MFQIVALPVSVYVSLHAIGLLGEIGARWYWAFFAAAMLALGGSFFIGATVFAYDSSISRIKSELLRQLRNVTAPRAFD
jgi:hypothetical protein